MKGFADVEQLFFNFPNEWFGVATICKYAKISAPQARSLLALMIEQKIVVAKKRPMIHAQALFYRLSSANRKRLLLQNHTENRTILAGEIRSKNSFDSPERIAKREANAALNVERATRLCVT